VDTIIELDTVSVLSGGSDASNASKPSDEISASSFFDVISYDSTMDRIRKEVWDKVRNAKLKVDYDWHV
jgi:hypothetical protein